ncbi:uncharacterized protein LOC109821386 [Asparagus officinalis]|uniref:uncharacterized protein LOC109821386 n=1 Tax=Asparagus officinalis TaxID=4686 RepID=UPI00098DE9AB|nr:uncharacterized protein LOC109821386 [Asparagus officinalis]
MGEKMDDIAVVEKVLRAVTPKFLQIASTLKQFGNLREMTAKEVFGRLKAHEERQRGFDDKEGEHSLLMRAEWEAKAKKKGGEGFGSGWKERDGGGSRGRGGGRGRGRGHGRSDEERSNDSSKKYHKFDKAKVRWYNCQNHGHYAFECRKPKEERAHFAEKQHDDEPTLLLTEECESLYTTQGEGENMMFHEENMKPKLSSEEVIYETDIWYLDTGASNHITGCRKKFSDLDEKVCGRVKFGDGSVVEIQGRGM